MTQFCSFWFIALYDIMSYDKIKKKDPHRLIIKMILGIGTII